jgi:hypothetical protein
MCCSAQTDSTKEMEENFQNQPIKQQTESYRGASNREKMDSGSMLCGASQRQGFCKAEESKGSPGSLHFML